MKANTIIVGYIEVKTSGKLRENILCFSSFSSDNVQGKRPVSSFVLLALPHLIPDHLFCDNNVAYSLPEVSESSLMLDTATAAHTLVRSFLGLTRKCIQ